MKVMFNDFKEQHAKRRKKYHVALDKVLDKGWLILGENVKTFEQNFANYVGTKHCLGVANGLEAIQIALLALDIKAGDEVITTPISAMATTLAIMSLGAVPIFVDVDKNGLMDMSKLEAAITRRTKGVIPVHLYGNPVDMTQLLKITKKHKLFVIEDAAQAHGALWNGKKLGSLGDIGCFSFYPTKNVGALGDAGALTTNSAALAKACATIRDYGQSKKYIHVRYGLNSRLDELHAAFLLPILNDLDRENVARKKIAEFYVKELSKLPAIKIITPYENQTGNWHLCVLRTKFRDKLQNYLAEKGVQALLHYPLALPDQPLFNKKYSTLKIPEARSLTKEVLSLPCYPTMQMKQAKYIVDAITEFFTTKV